MIRKKVTYIFKVMSSNNIGSGHIYRCLKLARKLKNDKVIFLSNKFNGNFNHLLKNYKSFKLINNEFKFSKSVDFNDTVNILKKISGKKVLIVDNYLNNSAWQKQISKYVDNLVVINDDLKSNFCDLYINENFFLDKIDKKIFLKTNCKKLIGPDYAFIDQKKIKKKDNNIFLFFGGHDKFKLSLKILEKLKVFKKFNFFLITKDKYIISKISKLKLNSIKIFYPSNSFYKTLSFCKFAITTGGSIIWDLIYNDLKILAIPVAKNQIINLVNLKKKGYIHLYNKKIDNRFKNYFIEFFKKKKKLNNLVDGKGLDKIVKALKFL